MITFKQLLEGKSLPDFPFSKERRDDHNLDAHQDNIESLHGKNTRVLGTVNLWDQAASNTHIHTSTVIDEKRNIHHVTTQSIFDPKTEKTTTTHSSVPNPMKLNLSE